MQLEKGRLYQVVAVTEYRQPAHWIIAEYVSFVDAHDAHGMKSSKLGMVTSWREPAKHYWKMVPGGRAIVTAAKGLQVRPVSDETLAEIARLNAEKERIGKEYNAINRQLIDLCQ